MTPGDAPPFSFVRRNRTLRNIAVLAAIYAALAAVLLQLDAAPWLVGGLALFTLPALWDVLAGTSASLRLDGAELRWRSGRREGDLGLAEIDSIRFDTRWDLSVRVTLLLRGGGRVRLPQDCVPPHRDFEAALQARGLRVERHHFTAF
ncbi:hypothetical protein SAMN05444007_102356 [Cribrihabitans marinus]|uniref:PH domain-containing protein n=1 Tax=Cribrihabitans marinus TaxID=1227549 RepID=A0A1H6TRT0_9RHOB|nr:hypothetical protein [Cribrihabitans marinus]GGH21845.1 hypothetical protein GCM10010973_06700 [Cribrihabitans marinus]SEI78905.1 hypothetical protein SAMN05444007_102356 [Cribrihabitans marinus]